MEMRWMINECGQKQCIPVTLTKNTFMKIMETLNKASEDAYVQINDPRFNNGNAVFFKKSAIYGWGCPESALLRCTDREERE